MIQITCYSPGVTLGEKKLVSNSVEVGFLCSLSVFLYLSNSYNMWANSNVLKEGQGFASLLLHTAGNWPEVKTFNFHSGQERF